MQKSTHGPSPIKRNIRHCDVLDLLDVLGVTFSMDIDGTIDCIVPESIECSKISEFVQYHGERLNDQLKYRFMRERQQFVGGPLNGKQVRIAGYTGSYYAHNIDRGYWACYQWTDEGRAMFRGFSTSKRRAKKGICNARNKETSRKAK